MGGTCIRLIPLIPIHSGKCNVGAGLKPASTYHVILNAAKRSEESNA